MFRYITAFVLGISLFAPAVLTAQDHDRDAANAQERHDQQKPEHQWSENENQYWHQYQKEHHKKEKEWDKASKKEQKAYWKWRDEHRNEHPDSH